MKHKVFIIIALLQFVLQISADNLPANVNYQINTDGKTVSIIASPLASGDLIIPSEIELEGKKYIVNSIKQGAFCQSSITSIILPNSLEFIEGWSFEGCYTLNKIIFGNSLYSIGPSAFAGCRGLTSVRLPDSLRSLQDYVFFDCSGLRDVKFGNSLTTINENAFADCTSLISVIIPDNITNICDGAFGDCIGLKDVRLSNSLTTIGIAAFIGCGNMSSITIPASVKSIGKQAFAECTELLTVIYSTSNLIAAPDDVFDWKTYLQGCLKVGAGGIENAKKISPWKNFSTIVENDLSGFDEVHSFDFYNSSTRIYNFNGEYVSDTLDGLESGMYIVQNGTSVRKIVLK